MFDESSIDDCPIDDDWEPPATPRSRELLEELAAAGRRENQAAAQRLWTVGELFELRRGQRGEDEDYAVDTWAAVGAEIAAALGISLGKAGSAMNDGTAMRRLPAVSAVFRAGDIDLNAFRTIAYRTGLISDSATAAKVDRLIAARIGRWPSMTQSRLNAAVDRVVAAVDPDAVRRVRDRARDRDVTIWPAEDGLADLSGRLFATDAAVLDKRLDALAATVCAKDPRPAAQRRADALGAMAAGATRLMCRCGDPVCPAAAAVASAVVVHVVADAASLQGDGARPAQLVDSDVRIPAELLADLAATAKLRPLVHPGESPAEPGYRPSAALAAFIRARDLTCRAPGCDRPAMGCDIDHTVPHGEGGPTHASNCKLLCRVHHVLKTFGDWRDEQLPDGTVIWRLPDGGTYVTTPGSALLFPALMAPTGVPSLSRKSRFTDPDARAAMRPRRRTTRAQNRSYRIAAERARNRRSRARDGTGSADPPPF